MLSSIRVSGDTLKEYITKYPLFLESLEDVEGICRSFAMMVFEEAVFNKDKIASDRSPYRYIIYKGADRYKNFYRDEVFNLLEREETKELYGLTYSDLMSMDYYTFSVIKQKVYSAQKITKAHLRDVEKG